MKVKKGTEASITQPLLKDVIEHQKQQANITFATMMSKPQVGSTPLEQPALYEDSGDGYNAKFVFPQD